MSDAYWIRNSDGTSLGPISLRIIKDLAAAGQLKKISEASRNGKSWSDFKAFPEIAQLVTAVATSATQTADADGVRAELRSFRTKRPYEVFGLAPTADTNQIRTSFFAMCKRYHPHQLPLSADPELRAACAEMFKFLSDLMLSVQSGPPPTPGARPAAVAVKEPSFRAEDFVGFQRRLEDRFEATVLVSLKSAGMFTDHKTVNIATGGFFIAGRLFPLGTVLEINLKFEGDEKKINALGKVVWLASGADPKNPGGIGVQFTSISTADTAFLRKFIDELMAKKRSR